MEVMIMPPEQLDAFELGVAEIGECDRNLDRYVSDLLKDTFDNYHRNPPGASEIKQVLSKVLASLVIDSLNGPDTVRLSDAAIKRVEAVLFRILLNYRNRDLTFQAIELLINLSNLVFSRRHEPYSLNLSSGYELRKNFKIAVLSETLDRIRIAFPNHSPAEFSHLTKLYVTIVTEGRHYHNYVFCPTLS